MKSLLIGLDLTYMDVNLIKSASLISEDMGFNNIYFIHVAKDLELPEEVIRQYDNVFATVGEGIHQVIEEQVNKYFRGRPGVTVNIEVKEGNAVEKILRYSKIKNIDLIMFGRKDKLRGSGVVTHAITRKSPCNLLLIPESKPVTAIKEIVVPIDFSKHSELALKNAISVAEKEKAHITCANVYSVPSGYSKIGKTYKEFADIVLGHAKKDFERFKKKLNSEHLECEFLLSEDNNPAEVLIDFVGRKNPDIIFVGSKGRTNASVLLLGSMAEKLTKSLSQTPLFIVKQKGENLNFFEALLKI